MSIFGYVADHVLSRETRQHITGAVRTAFENLAAWATGGQAQAPAPRQPPMAESPEARPAHLHVMSRGKPAAAKTSGEAKPMRDAHAELLTLLYGKKSAQAVSDHLKGLLQRIVDRGNITEMMMLITREEAPDFTRQLIEAADAAGIQHPYRLPSQQSAAASSPVGHTTAGHIQAAPVCGNP